MQDEKWLDARGLALQNICVRGGRSFGIAALSALLALIAIFKQLLDAELKKRTALAFGAQRDNRVPRQAHRRVHRAWHLHRESL